MPQVKRVSDSVTPRFIVIETDEEKMAAFAQWCEASLRGYELTFPLEQFKSKVLADLRLSSEDDAMLLSLKWS